MAFEVVVLVEVIFTVYDILSVNKAENKEKQFLAMNEKCILLDKH